MRTSAWADAYAGRLAPTEQRQASVLEVYISRLERANLD